MFYENLVKDIAPAIETPAAHDKSLEEDVSEKLESMLQFPEAPKLLPLFKDTRNSLGDLCYKVRKSSSQFSLNVHHVEIPTLLALFQGGRAHLKRKFTLVLDVKSFVQLNVHSCGVLNPANIYRN